tara:strand:- start:1022 stop:2197 length:1176 start_codon:yes stop_codon:yes gene_type:complete
MSADNKKAGLRQRPTYNELIEEIQVDEKIKLPNRQAKFLRESPYLSFLDGETLVEMNAQQENVDKQTQVEQAIRQQASATGATASALRHQQQRLSSQSSIEDFLSAGGDEVANIGTVGDGGSYDPDTGQLTAAPDPAQNLMSTGSASSRPHLPSQNIVNFPLAISQILQQNEPATTTTISDPLPNDPMEDMMLDQLLGMQSGAATTPTPTPIPTEPPDEPVAKAKSKGRPKAKGEPKAKAKTKAKAKAKQEAETSVAEAEAEREPSQAASSSDQPPQLFIRRPGRKLNPVAPSFFKEPGERKAPSPKAAKEVDKTVKPNPAFQKKTTKRVHGTDIDTSTDKRYWNSKAKGYIKDQLELRGIKIPASRFRGENALTKADLLDRLFKYESTII